jgi:tetratricopeptide (TPR) repeat protein
MIQLELETSNQRELRKLILSIKANAGRLDLLLAICDDRNLQHQLIQSYEKELQQQGITTYQTRLDIRQPSLKATLADLVSRYSDLETSDRPSLVTVLGASELLGVRLTEDKSEQEKFFFSLQWTREALREFRFPIVLWLSDTIATRLARQAPDFWSWRGGVFEFVRIPTIRTQLDRITTSLDRTESTDSDKFSRHELQQQIAAIEQQNPQSSLLVTLYNNLGEVFQREYDYQQALDYYEQALQLAQALKDLAGQARSLKNLGNALHFSAHYAEAIACYQNSLTIFQKIGDIYGKSNSLMGLGSVYQSLGEYPQAIEFHQKSLAIFREIGDIYGESNSLGNLGIVYRSLGEYPQAIEFYQQSLAIFREIGDRKGESSSLMGLGNVYQSLGEYPRAIEFHQKSLDIKRDIGDRKGESNSLGNLGNVYQSLGEYPRAIKFYQQSLAIFREIGDRKGEAISLFELGNALKGLQEYEQARIYYEQAQIICTELQLELDFVNCKTELANCYPPESNL